MKNLAFAALMGSSILMAIPAAAQEVSLRVANWIPNPNHPISIAMNEWADLIEEQSGGRIEVEVDTAIIGNAPGQYDLVRQGVVDIGWGLLSLTPGRFELSQVMELPFLSPNGEEGSRMATQTYLDYFADKEFNDTHLLAIHVHGPGHLHTSEEVTSLDDLAGMKIRTVGGGVPWVEALGATPVVLPASQSHEALARGVADGILFPWQAIAAYRLEELVPYHVEIPNGLYTVAFFFTMNQRSYDSLPADLQAIIDANSGPETAAFFGRAWDEADTRALDAATANDTQVIAQADEALMEEIQARSVAISETWQALADEAGLDGAAIISELQN